MCSTVRVSCLKRISTDFVSVASVFDASCFMCRWRGPGLNLTTKGVRLYSVTSVVLFPGGEKPDTSGGLKCQPSLGINLW